MENKLAKLAVALNYPEKIPGDSGDFVFFADGLEIQGIERVRGVMLRFDLPCSESLLVEMAQYASGRFLREDATLAWDSDKSVLFLYLDLPVDADSGELVQKFEQFADACEWWIARCAEKEVPRSAFPDVLIRP